MVLHTCATLNVRHFNNGKLHATKKLVKYHKKMVFRYFRILPQYLKNIFANY